MYEQRNTMTNWRRDHPAIAREAKISLCCLDPHLSVQFTPPPNNPATAPAALALAGYGRILKKHTAAKEPVRDQA